MLRIITSALIMICFTACQQNTSSSPQPNSSSRNLQAKDLQFLITEKKTAISRTDDLLSSPVTMDMKTGLYSQCDYLKPAYARLLKMTRGETIFSDQDPREFIENKIRPAFDEASLEYQKRLANGTDGTAGSLDAPLARLTRLEELICEEVEFNTVSTTYKEWKNRWDAADVN